MEVVSVLLIAVLVILVHLTKRIRKMAQSLDDLVLAVEAQSGTIESMRVFILGLEQMIRDALSGVTLPPAAQAKVDAAFAKLTANTGVIADAIDNDPNTPAPPPPPVP